MDASPDGLEAGQAAAQRAGADWEIEVEPHIYDPEAADAPELQEEPQQKSQPKAPAASVMQIVESALFVGGPPLSAEKFQSALRIPPALLHETVDALNKRYKAQRRPYSLLPKDGGYVLTVKPQFRSLREKLFGGPREARLSQPALDVLSMVAYRQPIEKAEIDSVRGFDSGSVLRQLVRLGLVAVQRRGESGHSEVCYGTTSRFLSLFQLADLDDLPRLGESEIA